MLKIGFEFLVAECRSVHDEDGLIPWRFSGTKDWMQFPDHCYPHSGMLAMPRDHPDLKDVIRTDADWLAYRAFLDSFKISVENQTHEVLLRQGSYKAGVELFKRYFSAIWKRAKTFSGVDQLLNGIDGLPWQVYAKRRFKWPPPKEGRAKGSKAAADSRTIRVSTVMERLGPPVAEHMFGADVLEDATTAHPGVFDIVQACITLAWERNSAKGTRALVVLPELDKARLKAWENLKTMGPDGDRATKLRLVKTVMKTTNVYITTKRMFAGTSSEIDGLHALEKDAEELVQATKNEKVQLTGLGKGLEKIMQSLNDPEAIAELEHEYAQNFKPDDAMADEIEDRLAESYVKWLDESGDLGVTEFKTSTEEEIRSMLSLPSKSKASGPVFPFFNPYISDLGLLPRDIPGYYSFTLEDEDRALKEEMLRPLEPRWHQYVGLAAMAKHFFNGENVVLADGVGVGKTLQCFMVMSYLRHMKVTEAQRKGVLPPIAAASQKWGWGGPEKVFPQGHILVCVPNMLTDQWESEALRFLDARYWNIVKYPQSKRDAPKFWSEVWSEKVVTQKDKEEEESVTTILIVSYSTLRMEAKLCLGSENTRQLNMSVGPTVNASFAKDTVFAQKWALTFFDEAQVLRTEGALLRGAHALRIRSGSLVFCSATPLHNSERDLVSLGLALGLRDSDDLVILEKDLRRALSKISRENSGNPTTEDRQVGANDIVAGRAPTGIEGEKAQKKQDYRLSIVQQMRQCFKNTVIRRRAQSTDNNGVQISGLLELVKRTLDVDLREDEKVAFEVVKSRAAGQLQNCPDPSSLPTKTFFNEYRLAIGHLGFAGGATPAPFTSKEDWIARRSTKWKLIVDLICALLRNDDGPFPEKIENNELVIPDVRTDENAKGKVVVYVEFTRTLDHLISGMEFEGLRPLSVTGKQSAKKRQHNISEFKDPRRNNRVLVLSSVGNAGLNLHEARFLIFADTVWSGQQEEQIIGRLHRQPNRQQVHVYIPRASGTSDVILSRMSRNKEDLLGAFMNTDDDDDPFVSPPGASVDPEEEDLDLSKAHNEGMKPPKATKAPKGKAQAGLPKAQTGQPKAQSTPAEKRTHPSDPRSTTTGGQGSQPPPVPAGGADSQRDVDRSPTTTQGVGAPPDQQTETQPVSHVRQSSTQGETRGTATVDPNIRVRSRPATPAPAPDIEMGPPSDVGQSSIPPQFPSEKPGPPVPPTEKPVRGATKDGDEIPFPENGERASMEDMLLFASQASVKRVKQFAGTLSVEKAAQFKTANASRKAKITRQLNKAKKAQAEAAEKNRSSTITSTLEQEQQLQALKISSRDPSRSEGEDGPASFSAKGKDPEPRQAPEVNSMPTSSINQFSTPPPEQLRPQTSSFTNDSIDGFDPPDPPSDNGGSPVPKSPPHKKLRGESSTFSFDSSRASGSQLQGSSGLGQRLEDLGTRGLTAKPKKTPRRRKAIE